MRKIFGNKKILIGIIAFLVAIVLVCVTVLLKNTGFRKENGHIYYYKYGTCMKSGWVEVSGKEYYASKDGSLLTGFNKVGDYYYLFDEKGAKTKGIVTTEEGTRYFDKKGRMVTGPVTVSSVNYCFGSDGFGLQGWNGNAFYGKDGKQASGIVKDREGFVYYALDGGGFATGTKELDGKTYIFDENGKAKTGFIKDDSGNTIFLCDDGYQVKGWFTFNDGSKGFADDNGSPEIDSFFEKEGNRYYADKDGKIKIGWFTFADGQMGYTDKDGVIQTGKQAIEAAEYIFDGNGVLLHDFVEYNGKNYYANEKGMIVKDGFITKNDVQYYLNLDGVISTGWLTLKDGSKGYALSNGAIVKNGLAVIDDVPYYFNENGNLKGPGWVELGDNKKGYVIEEGKMATGVVKIEGSKYYFDAAGAAAAGWITTSDNKKLYANEDGTIATGTITLGYTKCTFDDEGYLISQVSTADKMIAVTYDDGPSIYTPKILDAVEATGSHVTFFVVGNRVPSYEAYVKRAFDLGCEIASHTYEHETLTRLDKAGIDRQMNLTNDAVRKVIGENCKVMRPPGGTVNDTVKQSIAMPFILWDIDTEDWKNRNSETTYNRAMANPKNGDIILMHDLYESTANVANRIMTDLKGRGFTLVTISELAFAKGGYTNGKVYYCF